MNAKIPSETSIHHFTSDCVKEKDECWKMIVVGKQQSVSPTNKNNKTMKIIKFTISPTKIITTYTHVLIYACKSSPYTFSHPKKSIIDSYLQTST